MQLLYIRTLRHSHTNDFRGCVDILSVEDFRVNRLAPQEIDKGVEDPRHLYPYISRGIRRVQT